LPGLKRLALELVDGKGHTAWRQGRPLDLVLGDGTAQTEIHLVTPPTLSPGDYMLDVAIEEQLSGAVLGGARVGPVPAEPGRRLAPERLVMENPLTSPWSVPSGDPVVRLLGYSYLESTLWAGHHVVPLSLYWEVVGPSDGPLGVSVALAADGDRQEIASACAVPAMYAGALSESKCVLQVPNSIPPGAYDLLVVVEDDRAPTEILLRVVKVRGRPRVYRVPQVQHEFAARLGDGIQLLGYDLAPSTPRPEDELEITLYWKSGGPTSTWLKVFAHLVCTDSELVGQHDGVPADGEAPTPDWMRNEIVIDRHVIQVPAGAPAAECTVYVGMYSPDSGQRLTATDSEGNPYLNDAIPLGRVLIDGASGD
jgi:hypothetical protein